MSALVRYEAHVDTHARARGSDRRHVGLRRRRRCASRTAARHRRRHALGARGVAAEREQRRPGSRQAAAERAGVDRRPLDRPPGPGTSGARRGSAIVSSSARADQREVAAVQPVHERAEVRPLADRVGQRHGRRRAARAPSPSRFRDRDGRPRPSARPAPAAARCRADSGCRTSTKPPQSARRDVVGVRRARAEPLAFERARDQRRRAARAPRAARRPRRPRPRRSRRCRRGRSTAAAPCESSSATPRALAERGQQRLRRDAGRVPRRLARQPSLRRRRCRRSDTTPRVPATMRAVTSSPGASSAKPSTSNPHATFGHASPARRR